jgi:hypothetical protein
MMQVQWIIMKINTLHEIVRLNIFQPLTRLANGLNMGC